MVVVPDTVTFVATMFVTTGLAFKCKDAVARLSADSGTPGVPAELVMVSWPLLTAMTLTTAPVETVEMELANTVPLVMFNVPLAVLVIPGLMPSARVELTASVAVPVTFTVPVTLAPVGALLTLTVARLNVFTLKTPAFKLRIPMAPPVPLLGCPRATKQEAGERRVEFQRAYLLGPPDGDRINEQRIGLAQNQEIGERVGVRGGVANNQRRRVGAVELNDVGLGQGQRAREIIARPHRAGVSSDEQPPGCQVESAQAGKVQRGHVRAGIDGALLDLHDGIDIGANDHERTAGARHRGIQCLIDALVRQSSHDQQISRRVVGNGERDSRIDQRRMKIIRVGILQRQDRGVAIHDVVDVGHGGHRAGIGEHDVGGRPRRAAAPVSGNGPVGVVGRAGTCPDNLRGQLLNAEAGG
jgi:hypothetical protein